ncbi:cholesterol transporter ABCA5-like isoform X2 [Ruditapes philippinarum]|nr:cholesterol transporter ABCA5-like isoform X2 [Ruditapes philippinarum]XP_060587752.1 cholesterol transporter ABCA5-like isoform X2 [Ruditapes philippinarum]XP_060587753.1 cholesterol transporter ABCA5-like isoform X2 [Ruditapes philippinarum]
MQSTWFGQFKAMMYKVLLLKRRNKKTTIYEFFLPVYFIVILAIIRLTSQNDPLDQFGNFPNYSLYDSRFTWTMANKNLIVSPDTAEVQQLMANVKQLILDKTNQTIVIQYFANATEVEAEYVRNKTNILAGIVINYNNGSNLTYALRFPDGKLPNTDIGKTYTGQGGCRRRDGKNGQTNDGGLQNDYSCQVNSYLFAAFSILQSAIDTALIQKETGVMTFSLPDILVEMLPKSAFLQDTSYIQIVSSIYFVIAYSPLITMLTVALVAEKEKKIKEGMRMMGLRSSAFWMSYMLVYIFMIIAITGIVTIIAVATKFFENSNVFLFFMLLCLYGLSIIALAFLFTPFFNKATTAGGLSSLSTMLISTLYLIVSLTRTIDEGTGNVTYSVPVYGRWLLCLLSPVALALGIDQAIFLDIRGGMTFETASQGEFPLYGPLLMLLLDAILYFALAVYFDNVIPGEYGPRYKPWFIFTKTFWCPAKRATETAAAYTNQVILQIDNHTDEVTEGAEVEPVPVSMESKVAITINNLTKCFEVKKEKKKETVKAVNGLSLTIYQDQITAILGHNGAGKTTLLNILTGMTGATSGSARVLGLDVSDAQDVETMRRITGICPQHNILFDDFTCLEHLRIFAGIKGIDKSQVETEINAALDSVGLKDQKNTISKSLSGGQKRKLSVAIAVLGDPKIIILDEPTAGMDPYSRRHLWAVLKEKKKGRIILLTTHFMDEADILTDRKAIVSKGTLRCCGSSLFLKNRFGLGYHLNMVVEPDCDTQKVSNLVSGIVSGSEINRVHGKELDITLPYDGVSKFSELFSTLENPSTGKSLGVKNFGVSMTTLEEVFLKLEEEIDIEVDDTGRASNYSDSTKLLPLPYKPGSYGTEANNIPEREDNPSDTVTCVEGKTLFMQRFKALCMLRVKKFLKTGPYVFSQLFMPVIFLVVGLVLSKVLAGNTKSTSQQPPLNISPNLYTKVKAASNQYFPYSTVPRLLIQDDVNSSLSRSMIGNLATVYDVNEYDNSYYTDTFKLLENDVSPHYIGIQFDTLTQNGQAIDATYKVMYNDSAIHSIPASIALVSNFLLMGIETITQGAADLSKTIEVNSWPWPKEAGEEKIYNSAAFASVLLIGMAFSYIPGGMSVDPVKDRELKIRSQLRVTGLPFTLYWLTFFTVDFVKFLIPVVLSVIAVFVIQVESLMYGGAAFSFILLCLFYIPSNILLAYTFSFLFDKFETCQSVAPTLFIMLGYIPYIPMAIVDMIADTSSAEIMHYIFSFLIPPYNIFGGLYYIDRIHQRAYYINQEDFIKFNDYFKWSSNIPICYITSIIHMFVFFFLMRVLDIKKTGGDVKEACLPGKSQSTVIPVSNLDIVEQEDEDVTAERERVRDLSRRSPNELPVAVAENLRKEFSKDGGEGCCKRNKKAESVKVAVRNQTFAVEAGEVFGLLGPNGAGKTTTLNMMIADVSPDKGKVIVGGYDIRSSMSNAFQAMGYCPQHDALWLEMTLKDHLDCYAIIRGIPEHLIPEVTNFFIDNLKLDEHKMKKAKDLSGGTKRKLSYCMSMLGRPKVVLLDEPSTGMDPQSKRFLWDTISNSFENSNRGAILTTHYMEEADALCSRIAIMVNGTMECLGSSQHLKSKYGSGYSLEIKLNADENDDDEILRQKMERLHGYIRELFPEAVVTEQFSERVQYKIPKSNVETLSRTFTVLEQGKLKYDIAEYSFSQSTLEQVFLEFAKQQLEEGQSDKEDNVERTKSLMRSMSQESPSHHATSPVRL